jgi:hypothetical protein
MSKHLRVFYLTIASAAWTLQIFTQAYPQDIIATVKVDKRLPDTIEITGKFTDPGMRRRGRNISFALERAGITGLGSRISDVRLFGPAWEPVGSRRMMEGEYLADADYTAFSYKVTVRHDERASALAHVSSLGADAAVIMLGDLFPQFDIDSKSSAQVDFELPAGWKVYSSERSSAGYGFTTSDANKAVFFAGTEWHDQKIEGTPVSLAVFGERHFSNDEAAQMASEIYREYKRIFGADPTSKIQIAIGSPSNGARPGDWYAETRGSSVTIMSTDMAFKTQSLQRLHEQFRHEIFHLWLPNGVNLKGNYDWFYEGFAMYESLKTGVRLNRIRFDDFLDTLTRAHRFDAALPPKESLIDASENRWAGGNDRVNARGMLTAFLCDIAILRTSKGKRSIEDLLHKLYAAGHSHQQDDANTAVLRLLRSYPELVPIVERYVTGKERLDWTSELRAAGLEPATAGLVVTAKPNGSQKALLDKLGYNNWRKLSQNSK